MAEVSHTKSKYNDTHQDGCSAPRDDPRLPRGNHKMKANRICISLTGLLVCSPVQAHDWRFPWRGQRSIHIVL
jgi:hypothetical protein